MISSSEQYVYSTGLGGIRIDGGIMPLRSGEKKNDLRGEDIAFLGEAVDEVRSALLWYGDAGVSRVDMTDRTLRADRVNGIAEAIAGLSRVGLFYTFTTDEEISARTVLSGTGVDPSYWQAYPNHYDGIKVEFSPRADPSRFYRGAPVELEPIEDMFDDLDVIEASVSPRTFSRNASCTRTVSRGGYEWPESEGFAFYHFLQSCPEEYAWHWQNGFVTASDGNGGGYECERNACGVDFSVRAYLTFLTRETLSPYSGDSSSRWWYDVVPVPVHVNADRSILTVRQGDVGSEARRIANEHCTIHGVGGYEGWQTVSVGLSGVDVQTIRGDHTRWQ